MPTVRIPRRAGPGKHLDRESRRRDLNPQPSDYKLVMLGFVSIAGLFSAFLSGFSSGSTRPVRPARANPETAEHATSPVRSTVDRVIPGDEAASEGASRPSEA